MNFVDTGGHSWMDDAWSQIQTWGNQISQGAQQAWDTVSGKGEEALSYIKKLLAVAAAGSIIGTCVEKSFMSGLGYELYQNAVEPLTQSNDVFITLSGQIGTTHEDFLIQVSRDESKLLNSGFAQAYYAGKILGDILSIALGMKMEEAGMDILSKGIDLAISITVASDGTLIIATAGVIGVTVVISGGIVLEGGAIATNGFNHIGDNFNNFVNQGGGKGGTRTYKNVNGYEAKVNIGQQNKHIPNTNEYKNSIINGKNRSTMNGNLDDIQKLLDEKAGTGKMIGQNKERVNFGKVIGQYVDPITGQVTDTTIGIIHYGKNGAHIVPARPNP